MNLISLSTLSENDIRAIWGLVDAQEEPTKATVAWSFEGNGVRTRTTFIRAFRELGMEFTEIPNLLKTDERVIDLARYLDPFFDLYVIGNNLPRCFPHPRSRLDGKFCSILLPITDSWATSRIRFCSQNKRPSCAMPPGLSPSLPHRMAINRRAIFKK